MSHIGVDEADSADFPPLLLVRKKETRPRSMRKARSQRKRHGAGASEVGSSTTSTSYQDLDDLFDDDDDDEGDWQEDSKASLKADTKASQK
mmetsp:Transcript_51848/g.116409  ORF Transcript_51848/g.116409 Transcript_51848/m.116409 type:complete len:91 (-) Transcript_51848:169-441(-)